MPVTINGTTGIAGVDGSNTTPAIKGGTSTGTGVFYGTNTVSLATGGTTAVTVDSSQNVGIGTASPAYKIDVSSDSIVGRFNGSSSAFFDMAVGGTTNGRFGTNGFSTNDFFCGTTGATPLSFVTNNTERMRIVSSGHITVNTTSALGRYTIVWDSAGEQGLILKAGSTTFNGSPMIFYNSTGGLSGFIGQTTSTVSYNTSSDYRLKENIQSMSGALAKVAQLKPVTYTWKADGSDGQGFIAHELQAVVPDCVTGEKDAVDADGNPIYQGVDTSFLVATLTAAIQELSAKLDAAEARIAALEAK